MNGIIEHEVKEAYISLKRAIRRSDHKTATQLVQSLLSSQDPDEVWKFLRVTTSTEISHEDRETVALVRNLYENWSLDKNAVFAVHAVLALISAPKGTSAMEYISRRTD